MDIIDIEYRPGIRENQAAELTYRQFENLIKELRKKPLTQKIVQFINDDITQLNSSHFTGKALKKALKQKQTNILNIVEKELKIVPKYHYQDVGWAVGMFALPTAVGIAINANQFRLVIFGVGMLVGMVLGFLVGTRLDKRAAMQGRQLDIEIKH